MAENDTRVDALEDEVRRTLVDLRALLMREDSPLNESSLGRRSAPVDWGSDEGPPQTRKEVTETTRVVENEPAAAGPSAPQPAYPGQGFGNAAPPFAGVGPGGMYPPQMGPQPGAGWPSPQAFQAPPPPPTPAPTPQASPGLDGAMAERERRMAEQERRVSDQERKIADSHSALNRRDRDIADDGGKRDSPPPANQRESTVPKMERPPEEVRMQETPAQARESDPRQSEMERSSVEVDPEVDGTERPEPLKRPPGRIQNQEPEDGQAEEPSRPRRPASRGEPRREPVNEDNDDVEADYEDLDQSASQDQIDEPYVEEWDQPDREISSGPSREPRGRKRVYYDEDAESARSHSRLQHHEQDSAGSSQDSDRPSRRRIKPAEWRRQTQFDNGHDYHEDDDENQHLNRNGTGSRVYEEYFQLLSETEESYEDSGEASPTAPMDINLVASLVRWASIAKQRVGEDRLHDILDLYLQSGHATPGLRELLTQISGMADAMLPESNQTAQECVDLISHLHGILTGALAIARVPQFKVPA